LRVRPYIVLYVVRVRRLGRPSLTAAGTAAACVSLIALAAPAAHAGINPPGSYASSSSPPAVPSIPGSPGSAGAPPRQEFVPDLIAAVPGGITAAQLAKIRKLGGVLAVLPVDGGKITVNGKIANVLGVSPQAFRAWAPPKTAASAAVWSDLAKGKLVTTQAAATRLGLTVGDSYQVSAAVRARVPFGAQTGLSVPGADAMVDLARSAQLGLAKNFAVLINAPGANLGTLKARIKSVMGTSTQVVNLVSYTEVTPSKLPVVTNLPTPAAGAPSSYLMLYQESAKQFCPTMSWTVLAAIGEIESGNGANDGPSTAGALGPMQFMPATWAEWGMDGLGQSGAPDIMNPLDAVPSAAHMLCADGGGNPATLPQAIFDYNHATWYVDEVLALAGEYAKNYS
jgi:Transglycosylase SLT domain